MRRAAALITASALTVTALAACGGTEPTKRIDAASTPSSSTSSSSTTTEAASDTETTAPAASADDGTQTFGKGYQWEDGLQVVVSRPTPFKPSASAAHAKGDTYFVMFTVTIVNGTDKPYDPTLFSTTGSSGDEEAEEVFDTDNGLNGSPDTKILKGKSKKFKIGYGAKKGADFVLEVTPGFEYDSALFTG